MIVWGGVSATASLRSGALFEPGSGSWSLTPVSGHVPAARAVHGAVWTGSRMIVWGGEIIEEGTVTRTGAMLDPDGGPLYYYARP
jgi:hypothetical protein